MPSVPAGSFASATPASAARAGNLVAQPEVDAETADILRQFDALKKQWRQNEKHASKLILYELSANFINSLYILAEVHTISWLVELVISKFLCAICMFRHLSLCLLLVFYYSIITIYFCGCSNEFLFKLTQCNLHLKNVNRKMSQDRYLNYYSITFLVLLVLITNFKWFDSDLRCVISK